MKRVAFLLLLASAAQLPAQISPGPLSRAHAELEGMTKCTKCHALGDKSMNLACIECHREIAWLLDKERGLHATVKGQECSECHPDHAGVDFALIEFQADGFDHQRARWKLEGAHARLECEKCHREELRTIPLERLRPGKGARRSYLGLDVRCVACHRDDHEQQLGLECGQCHGLEKFTPATGFDHARTDYPLRGAHAKVPCAKCHTQVDPQGKSFLFPTRQVAQCSACHQDPHAGRFGPECSQCHVEQGWAVKLSDRFDHSRTRFALSGAHAQVRCDRCHDAAAGGWGKKPAFDRCSNCHADQHGGAFQADCDACHGERSFEKSHWDVARHAKTRFQLEGAHATVPCRDCHTKYAGAAALDPNGLWWKRESNACESCHAGAHGEQLASLHEVGAGCLDCHDQQRFKPATYDVARHRKARFALEGTHADALCAACHGSERAQLPAPASAATAGTAGLVFALGENACADCHADPHGQVESSRECERCHATTHWAPSTITISQHRKLGMELEQSHAATPCVDCHPAYDALAGAGSTLLQSPDIPKLPFARRVRDCRDCHVVLPK